MLPRSKFKGLEAHDFLAYPIIEKGQARLNRLKLKSGPDLPRFLRRAKAPAFFGTMPIS